MPIPACSSSSRRGTSRPAWAPRSREIRADHPGGGRARRRRRLGRPHRRGAPRRPARPSCRLPFNLGVGGAMRTGYRHALRVRLRRRGADRRRRPARPALPRRAGRRARPTSTSASAPGSPRADDPYQVRGPRRWAMILLARVLCRLAAHPPDRRHVRASASATGARSTVFAEHYPAEYLGDTVESLVIATRVGLPDRPGARRHAAPGRRPRQRLPGASAAIFLLPRGRRAGPRAGPATGRPASTRASPTSGARPRRPPATTAEASMSADTILGRRPCR